MKPRTVLVTLLLLTLAAVATVIGFFPLAIIIWLAIGLCLIELRDESAEAAARRSEV